MKKKVIAGIIVVIAIAAIVTGIAIASQKPKLIKDSISLEAGGKENSKGYF